MRTHKPRCEGYCALRVIGPFAILIEARPEGLLIGLGIGDVEDRPVNGHEPVAPKEGEFSLCCGWAMG